MTPWARRSKIVTPAEMVRVERLAYQTGLSEGELMEVAGKGIADFVAQRVTAEQAPQVATLLVGKGNNGGDAYAAGTFLLERGFTVYALYLFPAELCSPLSRAWHQRFVDKGGHLQLLQDKITPFELRGIVIDGLLGTGFHGRVEGVMAHVIEQVNLAHAPVVAVDIPSGLDGTTGSVEGAAIYADDTVYLALPKRGCFSREGWDRTGRLHGVDLGLPQECLDQAQAEAELWQEESLRPIFPRVKRTQHKYEAGYVCAYAGSHGMSGAARLSTLACLRSGAGIVRLFYPEEMHEELAVLPPELVKEMWDWSSRERFWTESRRARAAIIGPGIGRTRASRRLVTWLLEELQIPCVIDADALWVYADVLGRLPPGSILTPHTGEMKRLLGESSDVSTAACIAFAERHHCTLILKGAPSWIFHPGRSPVVVGRGDPGMATAGTGDVLTGILAALLAVGLSPEEAAVKGVAIHALAGEAAAAQKGSRSLIASDLIEALPGVLQSAKR